MPWIHARALVLSLSLGPVAVGCFEAERPTVVPEAGLEASQDPPASPPVSSPATHDSAMEPAPAPVVSGPPHAGVAVLRLERVYEECSGLGGAHVIFSVVSFSAGGGIQRAYFGGHGVYGFVEDDVGRYYVAEVIPRPATHRVHSPGWCVDDLPSYDGLAGALIAAADRADAERRADAIVDEVGAAAWSSPSQPRTCAGEDPSSIEGQGCVVRWHRSWSGR